MSSSDPREPIAALPAERWERVKALFKAAGELPQTERHRFIAGECGDDLGLRAEVLSLLAADGSAGSFMDPTVSSGSSGSAPSMGDGLIGRKIGGYTLLRVLGHGGMGTVYEAEQDEPRRRVALKIVRGGRFVDQHVVRLFRREVQALALLNHPHIAALYESGSTDEGEHYFVMELVRGVPLTAYVCNSPQPLPKRLALFSLVCDGITYAHQRGVVHRDLKPSNILVNQEGQPKILDFGLARITESDITLTTLTHDLGRVEGTLAYMSPEQTNGRSDLIDQRSDVYSLGIVLYELLTGQLPYEVRGVPLPLALRAIRDEPPRRPSSVQRVLRGDLETIVLRALEKEPARRYQSASSLAEDIERYRRSDPILARPPTIAYQLRKLVVRHKLAFGSAATLLGLLVVFAASMSVMSWRLAAQRDAAHGAKDAETQRLWESYLAQAKAVRLSGRAGQRFEALDAVAKAAAIRPSTELRNEAIAAMALPDVRLERVLGGAHPWGISVFSDDMTLYAVVDAQGEISVRRVDDDQLVAQISEPDRPIARMKLSPGRRFVAIGFDLTFGYPGTDLHIWDLQRGLLVTSLEGVLYDAAFSSDDRWLVTSHPNRLVQLWSIPGGAVERSLTVSVEPRFISIAPDDRRMTVSGDPAKGGIELWDVHSGEFLRSLESPRTLPSTSWSDDGRFLAAGCTSDHNIYLWDTRTGELRATLRGHTNLPTDLAFAHDGPFLISASWDGSSRLWNWRTGEQLLMVSGYSLFRFGPGDRRIAGRQFFADDHSIPLLFELEPGSTCLRFSDPWPNSSGPSEREPSVSPDERLLVTAGGSGIRIGDARTGDELGHIELGDTTSAFFSPAMEALITSGRRGLIRWPMSGPTSGVLRVGPPEILFDEAPLGMAASAADGRTFVAAAGPLESHVIVVNLSRPEDVRRLGPHPTQANLYCAIAPDGNIVVTGTHGGTGVRVWDVNSGVLLAELPWEGRTDVRFSPDGKRLLTFEGTMLGVWDCATWRPIRTYLRPGVSEPAHVRLLGGVTTTAWEGRECMNLVDPVTAETVAIFPAPVVHFGAQFVPGDAWLPMRLWGRERVLLWDLRQVRAKLAEMGLDWDAPPYPPPPLNYDEPITIQVDMGDLAEPTSRPASETEAAQVTRVPEES